MGGEGSVALHDNTDDVEPAMIKNAKEMVENSIHNSKHMFDLNSNDPEIRGRGKLNISFDPFQSDMMSPPEEKQQRPPEHEKTLGAGNTVNSKVLRALESPKSCQSDPE